MLKIIQHHSTQLPMTYTDWLENFSQPCAIEFTMDENLPWRIASVLVHGNEPSGFIAAFEFLKKNITPVCNFSIIISSIRAAKWEPVFTHRFVPGEYDLNRRFGLHRSGAKDVHDTVSELAQHITEYIRSKSPSLIVDFHNTSGDGPPFAVSVQDTESIQAIAANFTDDMIITHLVVGSLMEQEFGCPVITLECGGATQRHSHEVALSGLLTLAEQAEFTAKQQHPIRRYYHPTRIEALPGLSLSYGKNINHEVNITLIDTIERCNRDIIPANTLLGWLNRPLDDCLVAVSETNAVDITTIFVCEDSGLYTRVPLKMFMATPRSDLALSDCLFYVVEATNPSF